MKSDSIFASFILCVLIAIVVITVLKPVLERECLEERKVKSILELNYRDATIELDDSTIEVVNQATLKPGDSFCLTWGEVSR